LPSGACVQRDLHLLSLPESLVDLVAGDAVKPLLEPLGVFQAPQVLVRLDKGVLGDVLRFLLEPHQTEHEIENPRVKVEVELVAGLAITGCRPEDQPREIFFLQLRQAFWVAVMKFHRPTLSME
jgi:hypothetical protein